MWLGFVRAITSKAAGPIGAVVAALLCACLVWGGAYHLGVVAADAAALKKSDKAVVDRTQERDEARSDLQTCQGNLVRVQGDFKRQNDQIDTWRASALAAEARASALAAEAKRANQRAVTVARNVMAAPRPPSEVLCEAAFDVLKGRAD